jgi:hypothetical protein
MENKFKVFNKVIGQVFFNKHSNSCGLGMGIIDAKRQSSGISEEAKHEFISLHR